jgi:hypothetical protein
MKKIYWGIVAGVILSIIPNLSFAVTSTVKTVTGTVAKVAGNMVTFKTPTAAIYVAESTYATVVRRNGAPMKLDEILVGDKVEVKGTVWSDGSISATSVRNMSLYAHNGTVNGKIVSVFLQDSKFVMQNSRKEYQTVRTDVYTIFKKNGSASTLQDLVPGMTVSVKGTWERNTNDISAKEVKGTLRLVNIDITGKLVMKSPTALTVVGTNNSIYAVDIASALLQSKNGKPMTLVEYDMQHTVRVYGKHISGMPQITATLVKDYSVTK